MAGTIVPDQLPTDRELELLKVLWTRGEATVREVCEEMSAAGADLAYTTVLTLLQIMEDKQIVTHRKVGKAFVYTAAIEREDAFQGLAKRVLKKVFDDSLEEYVRGVLDAEPVSMDELDRLSDMIDAKKLASGKRKRRKRPPGQRGRRRK